jgi:hypothetical protein
MNGEWMSRLRRAHSHPIRHPPQECGGSLGICKDSQTPAQTSAMRHGNTPGTLELLSDTRCSMASALETTTAPSDPAAWQPATPLSTTDCEFKGHSKDIQRTFKGPATDFPKIPRRSIVALNNPVLASGRRFLT